MWKKKNREVRKQSNAFMRCTLSLSFVWRSVICVPSILYRDSYYPFARGHTRSSWNRSRDKGTTDVTHECGAISRHRYPQFNTRLRLRRVTAVNFRSRPIYYIHVTLGVPVLNSREQLNFWTFRRVISVPFSNPFHANPWILFLNFISFYFIFLHVSFILQKKFVEHWIISIYLDIECDAIAHANARCKRYKWIICE